MRKKVFGRKFNRDANERQALFRGLLNDLVLKESIKTTEEKAKSIKGQAEKLVTKAKIKGASAHSLLQPFLTPTAIEKVINDLAVRFASRPGGYTRIVKLGARFSDNAHMAVIEWVEKSSPVAKEAAVKPAKRVAAEKVSPKGTASKEAAEDAVIVETKKSDAKKAEKPTKEVKPKAKKETSKKTK